MQYCFSLLNISSRMYSSVISCIVSYLQFLESTAALTQPNKELLESRSFRVINLYAIVLFIFDFSVFKEFA